MVRRSVWRMSIAMLCAAGLALGCASTPEEEGQTDLGDGSAWEDPGGMGTTGGTSPGGGAIRGGSAAGAVVGAQDQETASLAASSAARGATPLNYNHFKIPLLENLVKRAIRDA